MGTENCNAQEQCMERDILLNITERRRHTKKELLMEEKRKIRRHNERWEIKSKSIDHWHTFHEGRVRRVTTKNSIYNCASNGRAIGHHMTDNKRILCTETRPAHFVGIFYRKNK